MGLWPGTAVVDAVAPAPGGNEPVGHFGFAVIPELPYPFPNSSCVVIVVHDDGTMLYTRIRLVAYERIDTHPDRYRFDDKQYMHNIDSQADPTFRRDYSYALRLTNWLLPASTPPADLDQALRMLATPSSMDYQPASWPPEKSQTILLRGRGPMAEQVDQNRFVYTSPMMHVAFMAGASLMMLQRGVTDFSAAEIAYEKEAERNSAWGQFRLAMAEFLKIAVQGLPPEVPGWVKAPLAWGVNEITGNDQP
jgi:hypothetical protein